MDAGRNPFSSVAQDALNLDKVTERIDPETQLVPEALPNFDVELGTDKLASRGQESLAQMGSEAQPLIKTRSFWKNLAISLIKEAFFYVLGSTFFGGLIGLFVAWLWASSRASSVLSFFIFGALSAMYFGAIGTSRVKQQNSGPISRAPNVLPQKLVAIPARRDNWRCYRLPPHHPSQGPDHRRRLQRAAP